MSGIRAILGALVAVAAGVVLAACGGDEEGGQIPESAGTQLLDQLAAIETAVNEGDCAAAQTTAAQFAEQVSQLQVEGELRDALVEASANLEGLTDDPEKCVPTTGATGEEGAEEPTTTETVETTTEAPETTTDTTTEEPPPDDEGGENGQQSPQDGGSSGNGNQGGGGGSDNDGNFSGGIGSGD